MKLKTTIESALGVLGVGWLARAALDIPSAIGASPSKIKPYALDAANYRDGRFHNSEPSSVYTPAEGQQSMVKAILSRRVGNPVQPVPLASSASVAEAAELAVTWYGHASAIIEIDGYRVLTDPVWSRRVSPSTVVGPARLHPVPIELEKLPQVDAVVISHDHYDHLDKPTILALQTMQTAPFFVPIGVGAHLRGWGVDEDRIVELDWGGSAFVGDLRITCTEARHFSGRGLIRNTTLWASWALAGPTRRAYFGGDTGYTKCFAEIGAAHGPFDLTLLPIGAYDERWPDIHMNPEDAVRGHADLNQGQPDFGVLVPIHWATFNLAFHPWAEPIERTLVAAAAVGTHVSAPMPGERTDVTQPSHGAQWWSAPVDSPR